MNKTLADIFAEYLELEKKHELLMHKINRRFGLIYDDRFLLPLISRKRLATLQSYKNGKFFEMVDKKEFFIFKFFNSSESEQREFLQDKISLYDAWTEYTESFREHIIWDYRMDLYLDLVCDRVLPMNDAYCENLRERRTQKFHYMCYKKRFLSEAFFIIAKNEEIDQIMKDLLAKKSFTDSSSK